MEFEFKERYNLDDFKKIVAQLRDKDNGCPWDKEQDHFSIKKNFIEETYEAIEAIDLKDASLLKEELGDVLLQIVLHSQFEEEVGSFNLEDVVNDIAQKIIIRHPHVFKNNKENINSTSEVLQKWEEIKNEVKGFETLKEKLNSVPKVFPALMYTNKIQKRIQAENKEMLSDENATLNEIKKLVSRIENEKNIKNEEVVSELLFNVANLARLKKMDSEEILKQFSLNFTEKVVNNANLTLQNGK